MKQVNEIHLKYVDDLTLAEAINLPKQLVAVPDRQLPDNYHARTGHALPDENSLVVQELNNTLDYAEQNDMKINLKKTKTMLFNPCTSVDFMPEIRLGTHQLEVVEELRLLGIIVRSDMKWSSNTINMVQKATRKLWMLRRLKNMGAEETDLVDMYVKQIRSLLELAVPAWQGAVTQEEKLDIERVQKCAAHIIIGEDYLSYKAALKYLNLDSLECRRNKICLNFAKKAENHEKFQKWFKESKVRQESRLKKFKYCEVNSKHSRLDKSPIPFLTRLLNEHHDKKLTEKK